MDALKLYRRQYKLMVRGWKTGFRVAGKKLGKIAGSTGDKWGDVAQGVDRTWREIKAAAGGSYDGLRRRVGS